MSESFWRLNIKVDCRILNLSACFTEHIAKGVNKKEMYDYKTHREEIIFHVLASFLTFPSARDAMKLINWNCDNVKTQVASDGVPVLLLKCQLPVFIQEGKWLALAIRTWGFFPCFTLWGWGVTRTDPTVEGTGHLLVWEAWVLFWLCLCVCHAVHLLCSS